MNSSQTDIRSIDHYSDGSLHRRRKPLLDRNTDKSQMKSKNLSATKTLVSIKPTRITPIKFAGRMNSAKKQHHGDLPRTEFTSPRQLSSASSTRSSQSSRSKTNTPSPRQMELRQFIQQRRDALKKEGQFNQDTIMNDDIIQMELDNDLDFGSSDEDGLSIESELSIELNAVTETPYKGPSLKDDDTSIGKSSPSTPSSQVRAFVQKQRVKSSENRTRAKRILSSPHKANLNTSFQSNGSKGDCPSPMNIKRLPSSETDDNRAFFVDFKSDATQEKEMSQDTALKIILGSFAESRWLDFEDSNVVGQTRTLPFDLFLPEESKSSSMRVCVEKIPHKKGFMLTNESGETISSIVLARGESMRMNLSWTPSEAGGVREIIHLKLQRGRIRIIAHGHAKDVPKKKLRPRSITTRSETLQNAATKALHKTSESNNQRIKSPTSPKHTTKNSVRLAKSETRMNSIDLYALETRYSSPRARKNHGERLSREPIATQRSWDNYNDELAEKQCEAYTQWLNYMFQSPDHWYEVEQSQRQEAGIPDDIDRPTLRTLLVHRRRAQATLRGVQFYNGPIMLSAKRAIFHEIITDKISLRSDQDALSNVMLRGQLLDMLMSYSTPWLRLGLEIIFGEVISNMSSGKPLSPMKSNSTDSLHSQKSSSVRAVLRQYIKDRVLSDPDLLLKYTGGKCKVPSGRFEKMYKIELRRHTLGIVLILIVFLDAAKNMDLIESSPLLFNKNGMIKSTKEFLDVLCRDYLHGMGNLHKHLAQIGIFVSHEQTHIDEIDFHVSNLATDLRDGVRLGKLAELLDKSVSVLEKMRLPAGSRLQKVHNVKVSLAALRSLHIPHMDQIHPNYIVDSHRPQVLKMLWHIMHSFQLPNLVDIERLKNEIYAIQRTRKFASKIIKFSPVCGDISSCQDICDLLLVWCQVVCSCYNVVVTNFSSDFADGRALCFLIHHYHPGIMPKSDILPTKSCIKGMKSTSIIKHERQNFVSANSKILDIGGIPNVLAISDSENIPDERAMIINIAYLCARLLESSTEIRAASLIQKAFRRYCQALLIEKQRAAVIKIEEYWMKQKDQYYRNRKAKFSDAVISIERFFLAHRAQLSSMKKRRLAAIQIQKVVRRFLVQSQYFSIKYILHSSATIIQSAWRSRKAYEHFNAIVRSTSIIQRFFRKTCHQRLATNSARSIQCKVRCLLAKRYASRLRHEQHFSKLETAAVICQAKVRRNLSRQIFLQKKNASIIIQSIARKYFVCRHMRTLNTSATKIQSVIRGYLVSLTAFQKPRISPPSNDKLRVTETNISPPINESVQISNLVLNSDEANQSHQWDLLKQSVNAPLCHSRDLDSSAILIQKTWRGFVQFHQYQFDLSDIVFVQSLLRRRICCTRFKSQRYSAIKIQAVWRGAQIRQKYMYHDPQMHVDADLAATIIQKYWRGYLASTDYAILLDASLTLQTFFRAHIERKRGTLASFQNATATQKHESANISLAYPAEYRNEKMVSDSGITLDTFNDNSCQRPRNIEVQAATEIQRLTRGFLVRIDLEIQHYAATEIQRRWRGSCTQIDFLILLDAARRIQQWFRSTRMSQNNLPHGLQLPACDESVNLIFSTTEDKSLIAHEHSPIQLDSSTNTESKNQFSSLNWKDESDNRYASKTDLVAPMTPHFQNSVSDALESQVIRMNKHSPASNMSSREEDLNDFPQRNESILESVSVNPQELTRNSPDTIISKSFESYLQHSIPVSPLQDSSSTKAESALNHDSFMLQLGDSETLLSVADGHSNIANKSSNINDHEQIHEEHSTTNGSEGPTLEDEIREAEKISLIQKARLEEKQRRSDLLCRLRYTDQVELNNSKSLGKSNKDTIIRESPIVNEVSEVKDSPSIHSLKEAVSIKESIPLVKVCNHHRLASDSLTQNNASKFSSRSDSKRITKSEHFVVADMTSSSTTASSPTPVELKIERIDDKYYGDNNIVDMKQFKSAHNTLLDIAPPHNSLTDVYEIRSTDEQDIKSEKHFCAIDIQRCWRGFYCRDKYEATRWGIILLQSHIRGYRVRETYRRIALNSSKTSSTHIEDKRDPNLALGSRTSAALTLLETSYDLAEIMNAIKTLEMSTRFSYTCCEAVVNKGSTNILFRLIRFCNRSSPHIDLLKYVLKTLMNISKHANLVDGVVCDRAVEILLDTIQMFRDKDKVLCLASSLLLMIVSKKNECILECTKRENAKRIRGVFVLCKKKVSGADGSAQKKVLSNEQYIAQKSLGTILKKMKDNQ